MAPTAAPPMPAAAAINATSNANRLSRRIVEGAAVLLFVSVVVDGAVPLVGGSLVAEGPLGGSGSADGGDGGGVVITSPSRQMTVCHRIVSRFRNGNICSSNVRASAVGLLLRRLADVFIKGRYSLQVAISLIAIKYRPR